MSFRQSLSAVLALSCLAGAVAEAQSGAPAAQTAKGVVFIDTNQNKKRDAGEPGLPGVGVSNGKDVVATDGEGRYSLAVDEDTIIFVIKPSGYRTVIDSLNISRFYYIHKPNGSPKLDFPGVEPTGPLPEAIDFPLVKVDEPSAFDVIFFGDPQPRDTK